MLNRNGCAPGSFYRSLFSCLAGAGRRAPRAPRSSPRRRGIGDLGVRPAVTLDRFEMNNATASAPPATGYRIRSGPAARRRRHRGTPSATELPARPAFVFEGGAEGTQENGAACRVKWKAPARPRGLPTAPSTLDRQTALRRQISRRAAREPRRQLFGCERAEGIKTLSREPPAWRGNQERAMVRRRFQRSAAANHSARQPTPRREKECA